MSWAISDLPNASFNAELDRYLTDAPDDEECVFGECDECGENIMLGEEYYQIPDVGCVCEDCISKFKFIAETKAIFSSIITNLFQLIYSFLIYILL